jgi:hypothetical protein
MRHRNDSVNQNRQMPHWRLNSVDGIRVLPLHNCTFRCFRIAARQSLWTAFAFASSSNMRAAVNPIFQRACSIACAYSRSIAGRRPLVDCLRQQDHWISRTARILRIATLDRLRRAPAFELPRYKATVIFYCAAGDSFAMNLSSRQND